MHLMQNPVTRIGIPHACNCHESVSSHCRELEDGYQKVNENTVCVVRYARAPAARVLASVASIRYEPHRCYMCPGWVDLLIILYPSGVDLPILDNDCSLTDDNYMHAEFQYG